MGNSRLTKATETYTATVVQGVVHLELNPALISGMKTPHAEVVQMQK
jgi:hypothetical protein